MSIELGSPEFLKRFKAACAANGKTISSYARNAGVKPTTIYQYACGLKKSRNHFPKMVEFVEMYEASHYKQIG